MPRQPSGFAAATAVAVSATAMGVLPLFLLGGLSIFVRDDLGFGTRQLGLAVSTYFLVSAVVSVSAGGFVERVGALPTLCGSVAGSAAVLLLIGVAARQWSHLVVLLAVAGSLNAVIQMSANLLVAQVVVAGRRGLSYGIKQSAIPVATLLAGASVGSAAAGLGWRTTFVLASAVAVIVTIASRRLVVAPPGFRSTLPRLESVDVAQLWRLAAVSALAAAPANALGAFLVESMTRVLSEGMAGLLLATGSITCIGSRLGLGWLADRRPIDPMKVVIAQMCIAVVGYLGLARADGVALLALATVIAFSAGWGWTGMMNLVVVRRYPDAAARATGITQAGVFIGAVAGPVGFGLVAAATSYETAWVLAGVAVASGAVLAIMVNRGRVPSAAGSVRVQA